MGNVTMPRPESYQEDLATASSSSSSSSSAYIYSNIAAGAESGWDFSSRWLETENLNSILYRNEILIQSSYQQMGDLKSAEKYSEFSSRRAKAINKYFFNSNESIYFDIVLCDKKNKEECVNQSSSFYPSSVFPLALGAY